MWFGILLNPLAHGKSICLDPSKFTKPFCSLAVNFLARIGRTDKWLILILVQILVKAIVGNVKLLEWLVGLEAMLFVEDQPVAEVMTDEGYRYILAPCNSKSKCWRLLYETTGEIAKFHGTLFCDVKLMALETARLPSAGRTSAGRTLGKGRTRGCNQHTATPESTQTAQTMEVRGFQLTFILPGIGEGKIVECELVPNGIGQWRWWKSLKTQSCGWSHDRQSPGRKYPLNTRVKYKVNISAQGDNCPGP